MSLTFQQAVYGRVERGIIASRGAGYQWAALSPTLRDARETLNHLIQVGRCPEPPTGLGNPPRFACFGAPQGWLAFTRVGYGPDTTGRTSYFAHHLLLERAELLRSGLTPAAIFRRLSFHERESDLPKDLPEDRALPPLTLELLDDTPESGSELGNLLVETLQALLHPAGFATPTWLTGNETTDALFVSIAQMQSVLPPEVALAQTFCLNFCFALDGITAFRLVTVPSEEMLARRRQEYLLVNAGNTGSLAPCLAALKTAAIDANRWRRTLALLSGHGAWSEEERCTCLADSACGPVIAAIEAEWPDWNVAWLAADPARYAMYHAALPTWNAAAVREYFRSAPLRWVEVLAPHFGRYSQMRATVCIWMAELLAEAHAEATGLARWISASGLVAEICRTAVDLGPGIAFAAAQTLADSMAGYDGSLHRHIAQRHLRALIPTDQRGDDPWKAAIEPTRSWLLEDRQRTRLGSEADFIAAASAITRGTTPPGVPAPYSLSSEFYSVLADVLASTAGRAIARRQSDWERLLSTEPSHRESTLRLVEKLLPTEDSGAATAAAARLGVLSGAAGERVLAAIERGPYRAAARAWLKVLQEQPGAVRPTHFHRLEEIASRWRGFFR